MISPSTFVIFFIVCCVVFIELNLRLPYPYGLVLMVATVIFFHFFKDTTNFTFYTYIKTYFIIIGGSLYNISNQFFRLRPPPDLDHFTRIQCFFQWTLPILLSTNILLPSFWSLQQGHYFNALLGFTLAFTIPQFGRWRYRRGVLSFSNRMDWVLAYTLWNFHYSQLFCTTFEVKRYYYFSVQAVLVIALLYTLKRGGSHIWFAVRASSIYFSFWAANIWQQQYPIIMIFLPNYINPWLNALEFIMLAIVWGITTNVVPRLRRCFSTP